MLASWPHLHAINFILPGAINWTDLVLCDNWIFIALEASKLCFSCERSYVIATALSTLHTRLEKQDFVRKNKQTWKYLYFFLQQYYSVYVVPCKLSQKFKNL